MYAQAREEKKELSRNSAYWQAVKAFSEASKNAPAGLQSRILLGIGQSYVRLNQDDNARTALESALEIDVRIQGDGLTPYLFRITLNELIRVACERPSRKTKERVQSLLSNKREPFEQHLRKLKNDYYYDSEWREVSESMLLEDLRSFLRGRQLYLSECSTFSCTSQSSPKKAA